MTTAYWCVLIAGLMPYVATLTAKIGGEKFDNGDPREWLSRQAGHRRRANAAQLNSFEAFPLFAAAVIIATLCKAPPATVDGLAIAFVITRVTYIWCYVGNVATLRSLVWTAGLGLCIALFMVGALAR